MDTVTEQQICLGEELQRSPMDNTTEQIQLSNGPGSKYPHFVGYFVQPWAGDFDTPPDDPVKTGYIPVTPEGKELKEDLDVSLSFLGLERVIIVGSSMGFLLCCAKPETCTHYVVCNPITRESELLPEPQKPCAVGSVAFLCASRHDTTAKLDRISYEVVRLGVSDLFEAATTLEIDTYSSLTREWRHSSVISPSPVTLATADMPAFVVGEVMFWTDDHFNLLGYNPVWECIQVWDLPWKDRYGSFLGLSEGRIHYARTDWRDLEMWVLEDYSRIGCLSGWVLKHRMGLAAIREKNRAEDIQTSIMRIMEFHPWDSRLILLCSLSTPYWYNFENGELKAAVDDLEPTDLIYNCIRYEWPYNRRA